MDGRRLSLVIPAYNEEAGIRQAVAEADEALAGLVSEYEILIVDDGSSDGTATAVREEMARRPHLRLLTHERNRGYGAALRTGFSAARFECIAFTDADAQFDLADLGRLLPLLEDHPVVVGYREDRRDPWLRRILSSGYNLMARTLLGTRVRDCDCALKVFRREALTALMPESDGFFVNTEMLTCARQQGLGVAEVGVRHRPRRDGVSKVGLREVPRTVATLLPFWWSRVLFPARMTSGEGGVTPPLQTPRMTGEAGGVTPPLQTSVGAGSPRPVRWWPLLLLLLLASSLFFMRLKAPLLEPQEPRYAEIARQMLAEGRWLVPVLHGQDYLDKPPLLYWLIMASYRIFGVHDWAARLVPGLVGVLLVLVTYLWGRRTLGERAAFWGALILCLSARFIYLGRMLVMDGLLALWVTTALAAAHLALTTGPKLRYRLWLFSAVACGLGLLTKGPIALLLTAVPLLAFVGLERRCVRPRWRDAAAYLAVALAIAAPWYVAAALMVPGFAGDFFIRHHIIRFFRPFDHEGPVWFYLPPLLIGLMPWTLLLPGLARSLLRHSRRAAALRPSAVGFFLLAFLWPLLFFSASGCKRAVYILPALPPLALALGWHLAHLVSQTAPRFSLAALRHRPRLAYVGTLLMLTLAMGAVAVAGHQQVIRPAIALGLLATLLVLFAAAGSLRVAATWPGCAAATFVVLWCGVQFVLPAYNRQFALRGDLQACASWYDKPTIHVVCYPMRYDSVSFYLPHADVRVFSLDQRRQLLDELREHPETLLLVKSGRVMKELLDELPGSMEFVTRGRPQGAVTVGWVRERVRAVPPGGLLAGVLVYVSRAARES